jgi:MerR family transcriptional regulator, copper efflux regulator
MMIGELARSAGVPVSTVRFYERRGLVAPAERSAAGYRHFDVDDATRVRFLKRAQELGFTLAELGTMLQLSRQRGVLRGEVELAARAKLDEIDARIADLERVRGAIASLLDVDCPGPDEPCPVVAALTG